MITLPDDKRAEIERQFGSEGVRWIAEFPDLLDACKKHWQLELLGIAPMGLPINAVIFAKGEAGQPLVLKLGFPHPEQLTEGVTLQHYDGRFAPTVVDIQQDWRAILMERILPGHTYRTTPPGTPLPLNLIAELSRPVPGSLPLPSFADWLTSAFDEFRCRQDADVRLAPHLEQAEAWFKDLTAEPVGDYLLHGDLHHENILLDAKRGWLAIDPKGVIGPRVLECGRFVHNFIDHGSGGLISTARERGDMEAVMRARVHLLANAMNLPAEDVARATYIDIVLSQVWTCNAGGSPAIDKIDAARRLNT